MNQEKQISILTNFKRMDGIRTNCFVARSKMIDGIDTVWSSFKLFREGLKFDVVLFNVDPYQLLTLCLFKWLIPYKKPILVSVDIHLSEPIGWKSKLIALAKKVLLKKVNLFILYFKDYSGYERYYGITAARVRYVPFKVNEWEHLPSRDQLTSDGEYVLTAGRGLRDLPTFMKAIGELPYQAILLWQDAEIMKTYGTELPISDLPPNITKILHDGDPTTWVQYIKKAKVVVIPALNSIRPVGISLYPLAMALLKPVVITEGPATNGLLINEAMIVPGGDWKALSNAISQVWEDDNLRKSLAEAGRTYAERLGGEQRMLQDIVGACGELILISQSDVSPKNNGISKEG